MALFPGLPRSAGTRKVKTNLDFTEARDSEWQWHQLGHMQVCTLLQTDTMPAPHHSVFYRPDALPAAQPTASKNWRLTFNNNSNNNNHDNAYGAVIMTSHCNSLTGSADKSDWAPGGRQHPDQAKRLGLWVRRKLAATFHVHHRHSCYYSTRRLILT